MMRRMRGRRQTARIGLWAALFAFPLTGGCELLERNKSTGVTEAPDESLPPPIAAPSATGKVIYPEIPERRLHPLGTGELPKKPPPQPNRRELATMRCQHHESGGACKACCRAGGLGSVYLTGRGCQCI
jgi:hypothetical protein